MSETYDKHHQSNLDCLEKAETGEPMFIILGRDPDGANLVSLWAERRAAAGDEEHAARVFPIAAAMADWPLMAASAPARTDYPPFRLREHPGRPDEMAAGLIHEPGTGGIEYEPPPRVIDDEQIEAAGEDRKPWVRPELRRYGVVTETALEDREHCGYVEAEGDGEFLARIGTDAAKWSEAFCDMLFGGTLNLLTGDRESVEGTMIGWFANAIEAGRSAGGAELGSLVADREALAEARQNWINAIEERAIATQQRDILSRQVDSLVQRLAASHVAAGLIDMAAAQGFVQKEILPINQVLAQIAASAPDGA